MRRLILRFASGEERKSPLFIFSIHLVTVRICVNQASPLGKSIRDLSCESLEEKGCFIFISLAFPGTGVVTEIVFLEELCYIYHNKMGT